MAFRNEKHRILSGSLNLLPPGDKIPEEDSLLLQNWRVDQAGQLRSRKGSEDESGALSGGLCHSLYRRSPNTRYAGIGARLYAGEGPNAYAQLYDGFDGQPLGLQAYQGFTWVMNQRYQAKHSPGGALTPWTPAAPTSAPAVAAGARNSKTLATFNQGEGWTITQPNGSASGTAEVGITATGTVTIAFGGTTVTGLGTAWDQSLVGKYLRVAGDALYYAILAVNSATELVLDTPYDAVASGAAYVIFDIVLVFDYDGSNAIAGESLHIACNPPGTWQAQLAVGQDLGIDGQQRDEDEFRIWIYASNPAAVEEISLAIDVGTGNFDRDFYYVGIPGSHLNPNAFSWTHVTVRRGLNASAIVDADPQYVETLRQYNASTDALQRQILEQALSELRGRLVAGTLAFTRQGSTAGADWSTSKAIQVQVRVSEACDVHFDTLDVVGGVSGPLDGRYRYYVTFDTDDGHETNGGPASAWVTLDHQPAGLTAIPVSADAQITKRHIYREGGSLDGIYRVGTIADNATTAFADTVTDEDAQGRHTLMPVDHDPAPACRGLARLGGRLVAFNSEAHPGRYWWTPTAQPWFFPASQDEDEGNWQDAGDETEELVAITEHKRAGWMYKEHTIWRLPGDPDRFDPEQTNANVGAVGAEAVANCGSFDCFVGPRGIYRFNGEFEEEISQKIRPLFYGEYVELAAGEVAIPINPDAIGTCVLEFANGRLYFSYPEAGYAAPTATLVLNLGTGVWSQHRAAAALGLYAFTALYHEGRDGALLGAIAAADGGSSRIFELETGAADAGEAIVVDWQSRYHDQGLPDNPKVYGDVVVEYRTAFGSETPSDLTLALRFDNGATAEAIGTLRSSTWAKAVFPLNGGAGREALNLAVRIDGNVRSTCIIKSVYVHWYAKARRAKNYDSGVTDLGSELVKQLDAMELDLTAQSAGTLTWRWLGDLPGGLIAQRQTATAAIAAGQKVYEVVLPAMVEAHKLRLLLTADVEFAVNGVRARVLEIGQYVDGTNGETWESKEVSYG
jgi:hypothetical protein